MLKLHHKFLKKTTRENDTLIFCQEFFFHFIHLRGKDSAFSSLVLPVILSPVVILLHPLLVILLRKRFSVCISMHILYFTSKRFVCWFSLVVESHKSKQGGIEGESLGEAKSEKTGFESSEPIQSLCIIFCVLCYVRTL